MPQIGSAYLENFSISQAIALLAIMNLWEACHLFLNALKNWENLKCLEKLGISCKSKRELN